MKRYAGSCHCGAVRFSVLSQIERVTECNCSICRKKGILHHRVPPERFELLSRESDLGTYRFGTLTAKHHFCPRCGIHVFTRPRAAPSEYTINVRVLDDFEVETEKPEIVRFDGEHWEESVHELQALSLKP